MVSPGELPIFCLSDSDPKGPEWRVQTLWHHPAFCAPPSCEIPSINDRGAPSRRTNRLSPANLRSPTPRRHLAVQTISGGSGISTGCPSPTTFVLGLGPTNPERTSLPQETLGFRRVGFSPTSRYSCRHSHFRPLQPSSRSTFTAERNAPLPSTDRRTGRQIRSFGTRLEPR